MSILVGADVATPRVEVAMWTSEPEQRYNYPQISIVVYSVTTPSSPFTRIYGCSLVSTTPVL